MSVQAVKRSKFWSAETSIFTRLAMVLQLAFVGTGIAVVIVDLITPTYLFNVLRIGVIVLVLVSVMLQFIGRRNIGFLVVILSTFLELTSVGDYNIFTLPWEDILSGQINNLIWLLVVSMAALPISSLLLIIGRPEWKRLKARA
jgi:hypothetical protein